MSVTISARNLLSNALEDSGVVTPGETPEDDEIRHALRVLNDRVGILNTQNLWPYTSNRLNVTLEGGKNKFTIGLGDGIKIEQIVSDTDYSVKVTTKDQHGYKVGDMVSIYDTENFDIIDVELVQVTERTFGYNQSYALEITNVEETAPGTVTITTEEPHGFVSGDVVTATDSIEYAVSGVATVTSTAELTVPGTLDDGPYTSGYVWNTSNQVNYESESTGIVYKKGQDVPDIRENRPNSVDVVRLVGAGYDDVLEYIPENDWDQRRGLVEYSGTPTAFTYYTNFPFGEIVFNNTIFGQIEAEIKYLLTFDKYELDDVINLPDGYLEAITSIMAYQLGRRYGVSAQMLMTMKNDADESLGHIKRRNYKPNILKNDAPRSNGAWDFYTDRRK